MPIYHGYGIIYLLLMLMISVRYYRYDQKKLNSEHYGILSNTITCGQH